MDFKMGIYEIRIVLDLAHVRSMNMEQPLLFMLRTVQRKAKAEANGAAIGNMHVIRDTPFPGAITCAWRWWS